MYETEWAWRVGGPSLLKQLEDDEDYDTDNRVAEMTIPRVSDLNEV